MALVGGLIAVGCTREVATPLEARPPSPRAAVQATAPREFPYPEGVFNSKEFIFLTREHGLIDENISVIFQDSGGFLWFGTGDGLHRYDGYGFEVFSHYPDARINLSDSWIQCIEEDLEGDIWVGTHNGGIDRISSDFGAVKNYRSNKNNIYSLTSDTIRSIYRDSNNRIWVGTAGDTVGSGMGALHHYDPSLDGFVSYRHDPADSTSIRLKSAVTAIFEDSAGVIWAGTDGNGLNRLNQTDGTFVHYRDYTVVGIAEAEGEMLWIATRDGLVLLDPQTEAYTEYPIEASLPGSGPNVSAAWFREDEVWMGGADGTLWVFNTGQLIWRSFLVGNGQSPSHGASISAVFFDREESLWIGTAGDGAGKSIFKLRDFRHLWMDSPVTSFLEDSGGDLWIGTETDLWRTGAAGKLKTVAITGNEFDLTAGPILAMSQDALGNLWLGHRDGRIAVLDPITMKLWWRDVAVGSAVSCLYPDSQGTMWVGAGDGRIMAFGSGGELRTQRDFQMTGGPISSFFEDGAGDLWVGSDGGGLGRIMESKELRLFLSDPSTPGSLAGNHVASIAQDAGGSIWIGTDNGISRYRDDTGEFRSYGSEDGLPSNTITGVVLGGDGHLWISSAHGLSRYDMMAETFVNYDVSDGLDSVDFTVGVNLGGKTGLIYAGYEGGITCFFPEAIRRNLYTPPILITGVTQGGESIVSTQTAGNPEVILLRWPHNYFEFEYAALSYLSPGENRYTFFLDGFDDDWSTAGPRRWGRYSRVPGGRHTLTVRGSNNDDVWNQQGVSLDIRVIPPFWLTWWFWTSVAIVLAGSAGVLYRLRVRGIELQRRELEGQVSERTAALSDANARLEREIAERELAEKALARKAAEDAVIEERNRLARELHDAVTQTLFSASLMADVLPELWKRDRHKAEKQVRDIRVLNQSALAEMRSLLLELRPDTLARTSMTELLKQLCTAATGGKAVVAKAEAEELGELPLSVKIAFYRIAQEALSNAAKHSQSKLVTVEYTGDHESALLILEDRGVGFSVDKIPAGHFGLGNMKDRARSISADLQITSKSGAGTTIRLRWTDKNKER